MPTTRLLAILTVAALAGCFNPGLDPGFTCGEDPPGPQCPDGFFCARDYTCQLLDDDGDVPPTGEHYPLGPGYPGLVAARLGDGAMVAGWFHDVLFDDDEFRVYRFDAHGQPASEESDYVDLPTFKGVERGSLKAAGSGTVAVVAGLRKDAPNADPYLVYSWIKADGTHDELSFQGEANPFFAVTANEGYACLVRLVAGNPGELWLTCHNGTAGSNVKKGPAPANEKVLGLAAALSSQYGDVVIALETKPDSQPDYNRLAVLCPGTSTATLDVISPGDSLRPQLFATSDEQYVLVTWQDPNLFAGVRLRSDTCSAGGAAGPIVLAANGQGATGELSLTGRSAATGFAGAPEPWSIETRTAADGDHVWIANWTTGSDETPATENAIAMPHAVLTDPHAVTDGAGKLWFFVHASDADELEGWVKLCDPHQVQPDQQVTAVGADDGQVTAGYAVAPRHGGGFFLAYRHWTDEKPGTADEPLEVFLAPIGPDRNVVYPP